MNASLLSNVILPFPPLPEQKRISEYLKEKMDLIEELKLSIEKELEIINTLPQSILNKAFRGEI
jgi:type I restriction enzyme S subunit